MKVWLLCGLFLFASGSYAKTFQFLYIEASEGNASGGHVALQLGDDVYHYQFENGLIRLYKHNADVFRLDYQYKQNRTLHSADIDVSERAYDLLNSYFKVQFLGQQQKLKHLQALQRDISLLQALVQFNSGESTHFTNLESALQLPGAGLFYSDSDISSTKKLNSKCNTIRSSAKIIAEIRQRLAAYYGDAFLAQKITAISKELSQLSPTNNTSDTAYFFSEQYSDLLNGLLALQVLQHYQPLTKNACFQVYLPEMRLSDTDIKQIEKFRQSLLKSVHSLLVSKRPDWGCALFVTLARLVVVEQSLQTGQWTFLDDSDDTVPPISAQQLLLYADQFKKQRLDDLTRLQTAAANFESTSDTIERDYVVLEMAGNRYQQWLNSDRTGELHYKTEQTLPNKSLIPNRFLATDLTTAQLELAWQRQQMSAEKLSKDDNNLNRYNLLTKNCVTALFAGINEALAGQLVDKRANVLNPEFNVVPFQAFDSIQEAFKVIKVTELPSYRKKALSKMYKQEGNRWVYLREANIFSARLYNFNPDDSWFVFFTDDAVLPRPLFGAVNVVAATGQSILGLLSWPFDGGRALTIGARGVLASLPELAFFNIRKGSYPYPITP